MTQQTGSQFAAKADAAAGALKRQMNLPEKKVQVGPDGEPVRPLPPEGSYLRMQIDAERAEQARLAALSTQQQTSVTNGQAPAATNGQAFDSHEDEMSVNATRRFAELTGQLREREQHLRDAAQRTASQEVEIARIRSEMEAMRRDLEEAYAERQRVLDQSLEGLDPETRATVLMESKLKRLLEEHERKVSARFEAQLESLRERSVLDDYERLSQKYLRYDSTLHRPIIEMYRGKNPNSSIEQAFKAVAEPSELVLREEAIASSIPPVLGPGPGPTAEHMVPKPRPDPVQSMVADAQKAKAMLRSADPDERKDGMRLLEKNLKDRLFGT